MIVICTPTRGTLFTRTAQCIFDGMAELSKLGIASKFITTHDLPIPDGHNYCVETALSNPAVQKIFFIEEDMYIFPEAFVELATSEHDMVTLQYNDKNGRPHGIIEFDHTGQVVWCGLGATVIHRRVFEKVGKPYFNIKQRWKNIRRNVNGVVITEYEKVSIESIYQYGGLDVDFCMRARKSGINIVCLPNHKAHHFQLIKLGEPHVNNGCHEIRQV